MKRSGYLIVFLLVAVMITGCTVSWPGGSNYGSVEGYVYAPQMTLHSAGIEPLFSVQASPPQGYVAVQGATVRVQNRVTGKIEQRTTNSDGFFSFSNLVEGRYTLTVSEQELYFEAKEQIVVRRGYTTLFGEDGIPPAGRKTGYYIVIGVDDYSDRDAPIPGVVNSARRVYDTLFGANGLGGLGKILINRDATREGIRDAIDWADRMAIPGEYLVIYFAGESGLDFLRPYGDDGSDWRNAVTDYDLEKWTSTFPGSVTVIIDGSQSSTMADGIPFKTQALMKPKYNVISSASFNEWIYYEPELGSSVFSHFLIKGIEWPYPPADKDQNGDITAKELFRYIDHKMDAYFADKDPEWSHHPDFWPGAGENSVIFTY